MTTGTVARILGVPQPRVNQQIRRGRVTPVPQIVSGRRVWTLDQVEQVALALGIAVSPKQIEREVRHAV